MASIVRITREGGAAVVVVARGDDSLVVRLPLAPYVGLTRAERRDLAIRAIVAALDSQPGAVTDLLGLAPGDELPASI